MTLSRDANLKAKTIEALRQYREALVKVEALEQEEDSARRAVTEMLGDIERAIVEGCTSSVRQNLFQTGQVAVARLSEISYELTEATAKLDASGQRFAALEKQLGYIPVLRAMRAASKDLENCSNGG
jgi:DNA repair ATPase RecN